MGVTLDYVAKETATNLWRNKLMALAAILTVAVSLSLVGTALLLRQVVNRQVGAWGNGISLEIFANANATNTQVATIRSQIKQTPQIASCTYLDHQASFALATHELNALGEGSAVSSLTVPTTPPVFQCKLKNPNAAATVAAAFSAGVPGVFHVAYPAKTIHELQQISNVLQIVFLVVAVALLVSSLVLILNAIRMAIFSRRREVGVMKLVGATNWFIRIPFMLEGLVQGFLGAVAAVGIVLLANFGVDDLVNHYGAFRGSSLPTKDVLMTELLVVVVGVVVGAVGSSMAVRRFLDV